MNQSRKSTFNDAMGEKYSDIDNELQMLVETHNNHDAARVAWTAVSLKTSIHTIAGNRAMTNLETILVVNKAVAAATTVTLPASPITGRTVYIKDGKGDAATNNITIQAASGNIDGSATQLITTNYGGFILSYNGTQWNILSADRPLVLPVSIANGGTNSTTALNNNRIIISSGSKIVEQSALTNGRIILADSNGLPVTTGAGALNGNLSFVTPSSQGIVGTTSNTSAAAGNVGEVISSTVGNTNLPTSTQYGDLTSISLTAGTWLVSANMHVNNQASFTVVIAGISTTSGNSTSGLTDGSNRLTTVPSATVNTHITIANFLVSISGTTTHYLKMSGTYTGTIPQVAGRITAIRIC